MDPKLQLSAQWIYIKIIKIIISETIYFLNIYSYFWKWNDYLLLISKWLIYVDKIVALKSCIRLRRIHFEVKIVYFYQFTRYSTFKFENKEKVLRYYSNTTNTVPLFKWYSINLSHPNLKVEYLFIGSL